MVVFRYFLYIHRVLITFSNILEGTNTRAVFLFVFPRTHNNSKFYKRFIESYRGSCYCKCSLSQVTINRAMNTKK